LYEPIHGSAPDIAGRGIANPYGAIFSAALLLRHSLQLHAEARALEDAVARALTDGARTADIARPDAPGCSTRAAGAAVLERLEARE
jgi:3-isopropylmalate dehydrogenase